MDSVAGHVLNDWDGGVPSESGGLGLPSMAERTEYSRFAASDPKGKLVSNGTTNVESLVGNGSAVKPHFNNKMK
jgi:hypothetical protein